MDFLWDENKRLLNFEKHGFDFAECDAILNDKHVILPLDFPDEKRFKLIGLYPDPYLEVAIIYTLRGESMRIISMRRARHDERRLLHSS